MTPLRATNSGIPHYDIPGGACNACCASALARLRFGRLHRYDRYNNERMPSVQHAYIFNMEHAILRYLIQPHYVSELSFCLPCRSWAHRHGRAHPVRGGSQHSRLRGCHSHGAWGFDLGSTLCPSLTCSRSNQQSPVAMRFCCDAVTVRKTPATGSRVTRAILSGHHAPVPRAEMSNGRECRGF